MKHSKITVLMVAVSLGSVGLFSGCGVLKTATAARQLSKAMDEWKALEEEATKAASDAETVSEGDSESGTEAASGTKAASELFQKKEDKEHSESEDTDNQNSGITNEVYEQAESNECEEETVSDSDFEKKVYICRNEFGGVQYCVVVKNNSTAAVSITGDALALNKEENAVAVADASADILGPGEETILSFYFSDAKEADHYDCTFNYQPERTEKSILKYLNTKVSANSDNAIVTVTNTGDYDARFVEVYAIFLDAEDHVVDVENKYVTDSDNEIKSGASKSVQLYTDQPFDHVEVYLTGRASPY